MSSQTHTLEMLIANTQLHFKNLKSFDVADKNTSTIFKNIYLQCIIAFFFSFSYIRH